MRNIIQIFLRDIRKIKGNTIAMIIMVGILVGPSLYAWFNIGGSWDPYENTSDIKIAVASDDAGYQGELLPLDINLGARVLTLIYAALYAELLLLRFFRRFFHGFYAEIVPDIGIKAFCAFMIVYCI